MAMELNEEVLTLLDGFTAKMDKTISVMREEFASLRAGRANPHILDKVQVDYYGTMTPINQMANISVPEPRSLVISLWDASMLKGVEKAILAANLGVNPVNDGKVIRLTFPELTEERRKDLVKQVKKQIEEGKVALRAIRRDALDAIRKMEKKSEITEDDLKDAENQLQKLTDQQVKDLDAIGAEKEKEIMSV